MVIFGVYIHLWTEDHVESWKKLEQVFPIVVWFSVSGSNPSLAGVLQWILQGTRSADFLA